MKLSHIRLLVRDYIACLRFYRDVMELEVHWGDENGTYISFNTGASLLALFPRTKMSEAVGEADKPLASGHQPSHCLTFATDDVDAAYERLRTKDVEFINAPHDRKSWGIHCFHFFDPDGNLIEINQERDWD